MIFDYYASFAGKEKSPEKVNEGGLVSGFVDECTVVFSNAEIKRAEAEEKEKTSDKGSSEEKAAQDSKKANQSKKNTAFTSYRQKAEKQELKLPKELNLEPDFQKIAFPDPNWFGIEVSFTLTSPWYSKDDRPFHILDNPVRKDKVFGVPFMSASSWKGLLRWACRMHPNPEFPSDHEKFNLLNYLYKRNDMAEWKDPEWILHLFGNEKGEDKNFNAGALVFYPTWFEKIGFEVINPHSRERRAGIQPIYYEVVPADTKGKLRLLYAPAPGEGKRHKTSPADFIKPLIDSIESLLQNYGISAKRTAGWGAAQIKENEGWKIYPEKGGNAQKLNSLSSVKKELEDRLRSAGGGK